jgi:hypothetical protein
MPKRLLRVDAVRKPVGRMNLLSECAGWSLNDQHGRKKQDNPGVTTQLIERPVMATDPTNQRANPNPTPLINVPRVPWRRSLALATAVVFLISSTFPIVAGLSGNTASFPKWWGPLDVGVAFVLAFLSIVIFALAQGNVDKQAQDTSYRAYRILIHGIFAMLVVFFLFGDRIVWTNCLTGFAWRAWLLLYGLPAWFSVFTATSRLSESPRM